MKIFVINAGSSSLKYQLINMTDEKVLAKGVCERIGLTDGIINHKTFNGFNRKFDCNMKNHEEAFIFIKNLLLDKDYGVINSFNDITAIGHRVVQGGESLSKPVLIDETVMKEIQNLIPIAPLHNGAALQAIKACKDVFEDNIPQVAIFDTAFHSTIPQKAHMYPIPYKYYEKYKIRKYGFHGMSHYYVSRECAKLINKPIEKTKIITCHIGNGSSITAIDGGKSVDTTMGFTPTDGMIMGTRCGSIDPGIIAFLSREENVSPDQLYDIFNKESGLLGISGISSDAREIEERASKADKKAILAQDILRYQATKYIAGYIAVLGGCDAIVFTAGIGENSPEHREAICKNLAFMGVKINEELNRSVKGRKAQISTENSSIKVFVIPTNEELVIARQTKELIDKT